MSPVLTLVAVALLGILAGGVINVLADDLPRQRRLRLPHYPDDTPRPPAAWLGITAFLLGKRRSPDGATLGWRHPITEIGTALLMVVAVWVTQGDARVTGLQLAFWLAYAALYVLITVIDVEKRLILFVVIVPAILLALLDALVTTAYSDGPHPSLQDALAGGGLGFLVFFILYLGGYGFTYVMSQLRRQPIEEVAFGYGDVMLITFSGLVLGWRPLIFAMFITVFIGALGALVYLVWRSLAHGRYQLFTPLPYGPYIVIGSLIMLLFGQQVSLLLRGY